MTPPRQPPAPAGGGGAPLADQVHALYLQTPVSLAGTFVGAAVVLVLFWAMADRRAMGGWAVAFAAVWLYRLLVYRAWRDAAATRDADAASWGRRWNAGLLGSGALWGGAVWLFYLDAEPDLRAALLLVVFSYSTGAIPLLATQFRLFLTFCALCFVPTIVRVATAPHPYGAELAVIALLIFGLTALLGRSYRRAFDQAIAGKARTQALLDQLRVEKAAADAARRDAEVANRAKTQFLAAASHDLRQPLHALGLFAEALRARIRDEQVVGLVNSINASVDALEGLFSELLDITKIEGGGVAPAPRHFVLAEVFGRLELHYRAVAFDRGLELRLRGGHHHVRADPVLVERCLGNLLANAIRYTADGGVLVSARRHGAHVKLQVWDTGPGIADAERERVFDEFYQAPGAVARLEPQQRKGLGLGLAIVKRLAALMDAPLALRSVPGRGTVFTLEVPAGDPRQVAATVAARPSLALTLDGRTIVVVEDDDAVRDGLQVLLAGWGARVVALDGLAACEAWARSAPAAPALAIVDLALGDGRTGVEAIAALRRRFGASVPAIVVTGSVLDGVEREADAGGFHLMLKPVVPAKLRAMIAFKLAGRPA